MASQRPAAAERTSDRPSDTYAYYHEVFADCERPFAFVDLDALDSNIETVQRRAAGTPVRVASKSVRCRSILERVLDADGIRGIMAYGGYEAAWLADEGFDDLLVAYPVVEAAELEAIAERVADGTQIVCMVDSVEHIERAAEAAEAVGTTLPLCLDIDMSTEHLGIYFGVRRSEIRSAAQARRRAAFIERTDGVSLEAVMGYEGQIAGLPDDNPANNAAVNFVVRQLKRLSRSEVLDRRGAVIAGLTADGHDLRYVNGGGTGCVEFASGDPAVTEVTVGSGFYTPHLFDNFRRFTHQPAAGYAIEVTRRPDQSIVTCRGGGYVASGPPGVDKIPQPWLPRRAELIDTEAAGEVQTPIQYRGPGTTSMLGDPVFMRHAKAGELCRNFEALHLVADGEIVETVPTYRGDGKQFF
ncbi:MAG: alanine racemase [Natrialbaceae archaeon]|nr:alanine racemase [Natrialbaceae archaeon]